VISQKTQPTKRANNGRDKCPAIILSAHFTAQSTPLAHLTISLAKLVTILIASDCH
jgi:hypothetical protein